MKTTTQKKQGPRVWFWMKTITPKEGPKVCGFWDENNHKMEQSKVCDFEWKRKDSSFVSFGWNNNSQKEGLWLLDENNNQKRKDCKFVTSKWKTTIKEEGFKVWDFWDQSKIQKKKGFT